MGIYWVDSLLTPDWYAPGYKTSVLRDPAGTILLAENTHGQQCAGNIWTCICIGPQYSGNNGDALYQTNPQSSAPQNPTSKDGVNQGNLLYRAQYNRFNYVFSDGHVQGLRMEQTIGGGTLASPKGMWTAAPGD